MEGTEIFFKKIDKINIRYKVYKNANKGFVFDHPLLLNNKKGTYKERLQHYKKQLYREFQIRKLNYK